jgi:hypothetical protein
MPHRTAAVESLWEWAATCVLGLAPVRLAWRSATVRSREVPDGRAMSRSAGDRDRPWHLRLRIPEELKFDQREPRNRGDRADTIANIGQYNLCGQLPGEERRIEGRGAGEEQAQAYPFGRRALSRGSSCRAYRMVELRIISRL